MTERFQQMLQWLHTLTSLNGKAFSQPVSASSDASFRRYYRIELSQQTNLESYIIMDAPTEFEDCLPFIRVSDQLHQLGLNVPVVIEQDLSQGFLLLTDLGNRTYLSELSEVNVEGYYRDAFGSLVTLQHQGKGYAKNLPQYDSALLEKEMALFTDWLGEKHLQVGMSPFEKDMWRQAQDILVQSALSQPQVYVHRDYHSRNLMITDENNPGILDFQDAVKGPLTYDTVSLIRDCYVTWPVEQVKEWQREYFLLLIEKQIVTANEWEAFVKSMDLMGIQRHLKAAGIFARLFHRDGKDGYLNDIPTTVNYIVEVGKQYPEMLELVKWIESKFLPHLASRPLTA